MTVAALPPSARTRVRRVAELASYEQAALHAIVDAAYLCHIAFRDAHGSHCIPTACWRIDDHLYIHGSNGSRMLKQLLADTGACVTITHLDALVLARSAFNHTMNYRSAMIYGQFEKVADTGQQHAAMEALMDKLAPGRQTQVRGGSAKEYAATTVLRIALDESAVKQRAGGPLDDAGDMAHVVWTGELPFTHGRGAAIADALNTCELPPYAAAWSTESA
ncbi:pyridoxamine 5'-phosphate oxidase family protein [Janthinobacterium sp. 1_2014MBL_MicDiv]|uniref:pyridoxamine 5'-phosphate oxidase family protein n=1 Tax=Janthinobacterium sp. 1_2014MBL_MicDiv TaxID=1644131 RepID=UPI0008F537DA|nr:pyridoxamine 5'-phosphate oxidase family protein [Janthinobacterium sp. 1_2014MBL_MicDiv]APA70528.1 flavin-nucleotide-binding protein [Janthinobacterium sp. 1_2014MBL_MicDiv]